MSQLYNSDPMMNAYCEELDQECQPATHGGKCSSSLPGARHVNWSDSFMENRQPQHLSFSSNSLYQDISNRISNEDKFDCLPPNGQSPSANTSGESQGPGQQQQNTTNAIEMLKEAGLLEIAIRTANLLRQNQQTMKELEELRILTNHFLEDVMRNPGNEKVAQIWASMKAQEKISLHPSESNSANPDKFVEHGQPTNIEFGHL